jgi:DNA-binding protein Fis
MTASLFAGKREEPSYAGGQRHNPVMDTQSDSELFREALQYFIKQNTLREPEKTVSDMIKEALSHSHEKKTASSDFHRQGIDLDELNKELLVQALKVCEGNKSKAAKLLGISRPTAVYRINKYGLNKDNP